MFIDKLKRLVNPALADSLLVHSAAEGTGVIPFDDLPKLLNAGNLKMPGSDISIADYYRYMSGKQILINADFSNKKLVVNQRMQDEYTRTGYTVDMWALRGSCKLQLLSDGLKVISVGDNSNNFPSINQFIENFGALAGKTVTCSVLIDELNLVDDCTCTFAAWDTDTFLSHTNPIGATSGITKPGLYTFTVKVKDTLAKGCLISLRLNTPQENSWFKVRAIKVEINDHQTLAHREGNKWVLNDPTPNYAEELAKCQRYLINFCVIDKEYASVGGGLKSAVSTRATIDIPLPTTMRARPAITYKGNWKLVPEGSCASGLDVTSISLNKISGNMASAYVEAAASLEQGKYYQLVCVPGTEENILLASADL